MGRRHRLYRGRARSSRPSAPIACITSAAASALGSAHLLAACNGGWLEVDSNTNPLRNDFWGAVAVIRNGEIVMPELPGLGIAPTSRQSRCML